MAGRYRGEIHGLLQGHGAQRGSERETSEDGQAVVAPPPPEPTPVKKKEPKAEKAAVVIDPAKEAPKPLSE